MNYVRKRMIKLLSQIEWLNNREILLKKIIKAKPMMIKHHSYLMKEKEIKMILKRKISLTNELIFWRGKLNDSKTYWKIKKVEI